MRSPRVLHLFANHKWTGPADPAIRCAARLRELGVDVRFAQASFIQRGGIHRVSDELWRWRLPVVAGLELRKHFRLPSLMRDAHSLKQLIMRDRFDILHCHQGADHLIATMACRRLKSPPVIVRSLYEPEAPHSGWRERIMFGRTQAVLAPTVRAQEGVRRRFRIPSERVLLQEPVTEPRDIDGANSRSQWGLSDEHLVVGITARIQPHRRFDLLWQTVRFVSDRLPNVRFVLLGRGNEQDSKELVVKPIADQGIGDYVILPGYQKGALYEQALRTLDAFMFLVPGSDGTCRAVSDAMAFGKPVVSTRRGILPDLLAERRLSEVPGFSVEESATSMGTALLRLLTDSDLRSACSKAALRRTQLDMNPRVAASRTADLYLDLLGERSVR